MIPLQQIIGKHGLVHSGTIQAGQKGNPEGSRGRSSLPSRRLVYKIDQEIFQTRDIVYIFVLKEEIKYIGYTATRLKTRLDNYDKGRFESSGGTNKEVFNFITSTDDVYDVYTVKGSTIEEHGVEMCLSRPLEYSLINLYNPSWNKRVR